MINRKEASAAEPQPKTKSRIHHRGLEFAEFFYFQTPPSASSAASAVNHPLLRYGAHVFEVRSCLLVGLTA
jgi:hypothetical protein